MPIEYAAYELKSRLGSSFHRGVGALLRVHFSSDCMGYADCHPWPSLGDTPLEKQLDLLQQGILTPLTERSLFFARRDAEARKEKRSLYAGLALPKNHFLIPSLAAFSKDQLHLQMQAGYTRFKVKLGSAMETEWPLLMHLLDEINSLKTIKFRLDFNCKLNSQSFQEALMSLGIKKQSIEFIEDPFPYDVNAWSPFHAQIPLAVDRDSLSALDSPFALIFKPAIQPLPKVQRSLHPVFFTSYLDHPLGQMAAAAAAAEFYRLHSLPSVICGLKSHSLYEPNLYSDCIDTQNPELLLPMGTGYGFDDLLQNEPWRKLE